MFAEVMYGNTASSAPISYAPKLSPMSQLMSTGIVLSVMTKRNRRARLPDVVFASKVQPLRLVDRDRAKPDAIAGLELREQGEIHARDFGDSRIAAGRLSVCHEYDRVATRGELHRAERDCLGEQLAAIAQPGERPFEPIAHPVRLSTDTELAARQPRARFRREQPGVFAIDETDNGRGGVEWDQRRRCAPTCDRDATMTALEADGSADPARQLRR